MKILLYFYEAKLKNRPKTTNLIENDMLKL